jgi:hypothetical protein
MAPSVSVATTPPLPGKIEAATRRGWLWMRSQTFISQAGFSTIMRYRHALFADDSSAMIAASRSLSTLRVISSSMR